jgi:catechol 2,3-dioxygenase-like lactoylglutathione lyase family enzyme
MSPLLLVSDLADSIEFYTKELGFALDFRYEDFYAGIVKDGCSIHLKVGNPSSDERRNKRSNDDLDITFSIDSLDDLYQELSNKPIDLVQPIRDMPYGREFYVADPDGYIIGFLSEK